MRESAGECGGEGVKANQRESGRKTEREYG